LGLNPAVQPGRSWEGTRKAANAPVRTGTRLTLGVKEGPPCLSCILTSASPIPLTRWGAAAEPVTGPFPYDQLVPHGKRSPTMAFTIDATPEQVWPWFVQMGWDLGGWYSWDLLDNAGRRSAEAVHPEWQDLAVGDQLRFWALGRILDAYRVAIIEPDKFPWPLRIHRSERPLARFQGATAVLLHSNTMGLADERTCRPAHSTRDQRLPIVPPSVG
jgi:hypothetical protein